MFFLSKDIAESRPARLVDAGSTADIIQSLTLPYAAAGKAAVISTIIAVGATYDNVFRPQSKLSLRDEILIKQALTTAIGLGFSVADTLSIETVNLNQGQDYHSEKPYHGDLVVLCCIPKWGNSDPFKIHESRLTSPHGNSPRRWRQSLEKRNPLMAVSSEATDCRGEITVRRSRPDTYQHIEPVDFRAETFRQNEPRNFTMHAIIRKDIAARLAL